MNEWGEITVERNTWQDGHTTARITRADDHCLIHPNLIQAIREQQLDWARITDDLLTFDDGETRVTYRLGGNVMSGWNSGIRADRVRPTTPSHLPDPPRIPERQGKAVSEAHTANTGHVSERESQ